MPSTLSRAANGYIVYECEHVIATLIDNVLFKYHEIGNIGVFTPEVISYVLSKQTTKNWKLGKCDFNKQFLYKWENENLCCALFSIPKPFVEDYHFTYDTTTYPWTLNLLAAETAVGCEIRYRKNMQAIEKYVDPANLVTRIYPLGYGEGDNQLTIESVNNKVPYLEADTVGTYGMKEVIWVDRRYEDAESMKATAQSMLNELKVPYISYSVTSVDLFKKTGDAFDEFKEGKVVRVIDKEDNINIDTKIVEIQKDDVTSANINVVIANKNKSVAGSIAEMQERARINETYAQGSATLMTIPYVDNADVGYPATFEFFLPSSMVNINKAFLRIQNQPFRGYSKAIKGGGDIATSTQSGGGSQQTSTSGGGTTTSTQSGGGSQQTSSSGGGTTATTQSGGRTTATAAGDPNAQWGDRETTKPSSSHSHTESGGGTTSESGNQHTHKVSVVILHSHIVDIPDHIHDLIIKDHSHSVTIPAHTHVITIQDHSHNITIPAHMHSVTIPEHTHDIQFGIFVGTTANSLSIKVDGKAMPTLTDYNNIDIIKYLSTDKSGKILRDTWHSVEIVPDRLTRLSAYLFLDIFTNSRGGGDY